MDITDDHIKMLKSAAMVEEAIKACYRTIADMAKMESECRTNRLKCEAYLGEMLAAKMILESRRDL